MKNFNFLFFITMIFITSCNDSINTQEIFFENQIIFRKIENSIKKEYSMVIEKDTPAASNPNFDSTYLDNFKQIFEKTPYDIAYVSDGDVLFGHKKELSYLCFSTKGLNGTIALFNFTGSIEYLLENGKSQTPPFAIKITTNWYIMNDVNSF